MIAGLLAAVADALALQRAALLAEFGWTQLDLRALAEPEARVLRLRGQVALPRMIGAAQRAVAPLLPPGWRLDAAEVLPRAPLGRRAPGPGVTALWRTPGLALRAGGHGPRAMSLWTGRNVHGLSGMFLETCSEEQATSGLSSELLPGDGALELLAELPGCALVRAADGTVGWVRAAAGARGRPLRAPGRGARVGPADGRTREALADAAPRAGRGARGAAALRRLTASLRGYLGVRYRLGGTTRVHIDCSGLVQRAVREALGLVLPRHSTDQLALGATPARALGEPGDLLFMAGGDEAGCHVGVVLRGPRSGARTLLHASASRGRVIEEPLDGCLARVRRVQHLELAQLLER